MTTELHSTGTDGAHRPPPNPRSATVLFAHPGADMFGSDRMLLESVQAARDCGARVVVALPCTGPLDAALRDRGAETNVAPDFVLRKALLAPRQWPRFVRSAWQGLRTSLQLIGRVRPDVVYVSTSVLPLWPLVCRLRGVRCVSHLHEAESGGNPLRNRLLYLPHLASDLVLTNSMFSRRTILAAVPMLTGRVQVVYNGIVSPPDPPPLPAARPDVTRLLFVGRLSPRKAPHLVISAAGLLREEGVEVEVTIVGAVFRGYEWYERRLREQAARSGVSVVFAGYQHRVWEFLATCDVLIVPSIEDESFGNVAVEGMLARRPVVVSDVAGLIEATSPCYRSVRTAHAGDPHALAAAVRSISARWETLPDRVDASRDIAAERHAPQVYRAAIASALLGIPQRDGHRTQTEKPAVSTAF